MPGTPNSLLTTQTTNNIIQNFITNDGNCGVQLGSGIAGVKLLYTAGPSGSIIKSLMANSDDTSARVVTLVIDNLTSKYCIGTINVPLQAGQTGAIPNVDMLANANLLGFVVDAAGKNVIQLQANYKLWAGVQTTMTAAKTLNIIGSAEDY